MRAVHAVAVIILTLLGLFVVSTVQSDAGEQPDSCRFIGTIDMYVQAGTQVDLNDLMTTPDKFGEYRCHMSGMRIFKSVSNTRHEYAGLRAVAEWSRKRAAGPDSKAGIYKDQVSVLCGDGGHGWLLTPTFYVSRRIPHLSPREKNYWPTWARRYAERHDCTVY